VGRLLDRRDRLDAPVEVARHPVGRADVDLLLAAVEKVVRPTVLQEPAHDADHADGLADTRQTGPQAADAADDEVHRHACLRRLVEGDDQLRVHQRVHLGDDARAPAGLPVLQLPPDHAEEALPHPARRHDQLPVTRG
jgi:hypothetical protein